jgi:uncharacterized membrane protein HdeD (DUF308 family)
MLADVLSRYWWTTLIRGVIWVLFGIVAFTRPGISLLTLTLLFGGFAFIDGIAHVVSAFGGRRENERWWVLLLTGLAGVLVGVLTFMNPGMTALALLFVIAVWAMATGFLEIVAAIRLRHEIRGEGWLVLAGLVSIAFGASLLFRPLTGALAVIWVIGAYAVVLGIVLIVLSFRARGFVHRALAAMNAPRTGRLPG